jgi:adenosylhomocysteinase
VCSVARSPLKDTEDLLVGQSVLFSTDVLMRELGLLLQYLNCGVLGYGKIGRSIAFHLMQRGIRTSVYDTDPIRRLQAFNYQCNAADRDTIIVAADVLFCATGNQAINIHDIRRLRPGCFVVSVTSSDDEMDLKYLQGEYSKEAVSKYISIYRSFNNWFYLVNSGNAVNFIHSAVIGDFIHLVRAEMLTALHYLVESRPAPALFELDRSQRATVAALWLRCFVDDDLTLAS